MVGKLCKYVLILTAIVGLLASCDPASSSTVYLYNKSSHDIRLSISTRYNKIDDQTVLKEQIGRFEAPAALGLHSVSPTRTLDKITIYDATTNEVLKEINTLDQVLRLLKIEKNSIGTEHADYIVVLTDDILNKS